MSLSVTRGPVLKTYSRRRSRASSRNEGNINSSTNIESSPLHDLEDQTDITLAEMSKRMKKRSRNVMNTTTALVPNDTHVLLSAKRPKVQDSIFSDDSTAPSTPEIPRSLLLPLQNQDPNEASYQTPKVLPPSEQSMSFSDAALPEQFSPIPVARRILSRTSSRNFKENARNRSLASPFSSHPNSQVSTPFRINQRSHLKSRTLSSNLSKRPDTQALRRLPSVDVLNQNSTNNNINAQDVSNIMHHRSGSIPNIPVTQQSTSQDWLVSAKSITRSPLQLQFNEELDAFQAEHPSFYFDCPAQISTPARKPVNTAPRPEFHRPTCYSDDSDADISDVDFDIPSKEPAPQAPPPIASPRKPGRPRRRTILHVSSDSIFSSALDFSTYMTDEESPDRIRKSSTKERMRSRTITGSRPTTIFQTVNRESQAYLAPAFSPAHDIPSSQVPDAALDHDTVTNAPADNEELHDMFSVLGLDEEPPFNDSGIEFAEPPSPLAEKSSTGHRRKRGDTIRASDFPSRPILKPVSSASIPEVSQSTKASRPTRRTRSGTVTLASIKSAASSSQATSTATFIGEGTANSRGNGQKQARRRRPTIKVKIDDEPLPPQASDEEDDELLLVHGVMWKDE
ncbi:hypothetical protein ABKN59_003608 [Abortiporus biennis]